MKQYNLSVLVTSGPTRERIDPVRFISNNSSGKQGHAIAEAFANAGADVTLISGPVSIPAPKDVKLVNVESAQEMLDACEAALPVDAAICTAAVSDWCLAKPFEQKQKKQPGQQSLNLELRQTPDILHHLSNHPEHRPRLVVGFAAETENLVQYAKDKMQRKGCDWVLANDVSNNQIFGHDTTSLQLITQTTEEAWENLSKKDAAEMLCKKILSYL